MRAFIRYIVSNFVCCFYIGGILGRYPIHFHMCGSSAGSVVSKNVIINSNQRCVFIHDTNDVSIEDNVGKKKPESYYSAYLVLILRFSSLCALVLQYPACTSI